ncbi:MAG TPA: cobalamin-dependent protein [Anaerolineales bacterium]|nr:cobalamin-dependent protein [Anaerolineales bacterium]
MSNPQDLKAEFVTRLLECEAEEMVAWSQGIINQGMAPLDFFNQVFTPGMAEIGDKFSRLDIFLPELMDSAEKAKTISDRVLAPLLAKNTASHSLAQGKVLIASVKGDLHDIGKNMVSLMLQVNSFEVIDIGVNVAPREILERAKELGVNIVALSSLMTTSMPYMKEVVELRDAFGLKNKFAIIVGGAPITKEYSEAIGADAFGHDAVEAVQKCMLLMDRTVVS